MLTSHIKVINIFRLSISFESTSGNYIFATQHHLVYEVLKILAYNMCMYAYLHTYMHIYMQTVKNN